MLASVAIAARRQEPIDLDLRLARLRQMVINSVIAKNSKRNCARALDDLFLFRCRPTFHSRPADGAAGCYEQSLASVNVRLSAT